MAALGNNEHRHHPMKIPTINAARLKIAEAAAQFATTKLHATRAAYDGKRELARWWGQCARIDWRNLESLLTE